MASAGGHGFKACTSSLLVLVMGCTPLALPPPIFRHADEGHPLHTLLSDAGGPTRLGSVYAKSVPCTGSNREHQGFFGVAHDAKKVTIVDHFSHGDAP